MSNYPNKQTCFELIFQMSKTRLITIAVFPFSTEAHIVRAKLESQGIVVFLKDLNMVDIDPLATIAIGGIKLQVPKDQVQQATNIYWETFGFPKEKNHCPFCGSSLILQKKIPKSLFIRWIFTIVNQLFPFWHTPVFTCFDCDNEFKL